MNDPIPAPDAAEEALRDVERRYRDLVEGARNVVLRLSDQGVLSFVNRTFETITGWAPHSCLGRPFVDLVHADDRPRAAEALRRTLGGDSPVPLDLRISSENGPSDRVLEFTLVPHARDGRVAGVIGTATDVTSRREQEATLRRTESEFRQLVASVQAIVWRADAATLEMRFVSQEAESLLRYPLALWTDEPAFWQEHIHPEDREWAVTLRARAGAEGRNYDAEYRMITADGRVVWVRDVVRARGGERRQGELIGFTTDVTERRQAEEDLRRSRDRLSELSAHIEWAREEERTGIAREIHDELGQALTALRMDVSWLRGRLAGPLPDDRTPLLAKLQEMVELIDDTIGRARRISTELRPGVLDDLGLEAAASWLTEDFQRRTGVRCQLASALPALTLEREASTALFRILQEALTNVSRHAEASQVQVELGQEGGRLVLEVRDNGRGTAEGRPSGRRSLGVLGMMERARRLGGTLTFTSAPGAGTVVQASVPLSALQGHAGPEAPP